MKSNFALSLSFDGLRLMHRTAGGWHLVGEVALDDADVSGALARLREAAQTLEAGGIATKLLIPNDQIKYIALDTTRADEDQVREALHGATPYSVDELTYDFVKGGGRTYVAAVARDTLAEAQQFAAEHGFNPVSFAAVPEPFTYVGEAFFGATDGNTAERDAEPVIIIGAADVTLEPTESVMENADTAPDPIAPAAIKEPVEPKTNTPEIEADTTDDAQATAPQEDEPQDAEPPAENLVPDTTIDDAIIDDATSDDTPSDDTGIDDTPADDTAIDDAPADDTLAEDAPAEDTPTQAAEPEPDLEETSAPVFTSRLRADRNEGRPAQQPAQQPATRTEPTVSRAPAPLAVPTDAGDASVPPLAAPNRDTPDQDTAFAPITTDAPDVDAAAPITGDAPTALSADAAVAAASLTVEPDPQDPAPEETPRSATATAVGAATAVGGAVGGMFASRRMARAQAREQEADAPESAPRKTVFGARKQPKPKPVVGGKPRFLGLILTAILLLFLLAIAAFAALSEDGLAGWFGFGSDDTQIAASDPVAPPAAPDETPAIAPPTADAADALAIPTQPSGGQVLTPEEATRIYAATGVWQRAPRIPVNPRTTSLDAMSVGTAPTTVARVPSSPLASVSSISGDALIPTPIDPPAPDTTFAFGADGLIVATPQGNVTPDGILVIAGTPTLNPPTRPGTVAPEITPQDQIAAVIPETAAPVADAPQGVIVIAGRPSIEPPVRTGTAAPAPAPQAAALASGQTPLLATDGILVLAGSPSILPPVRPGTLAPTATPAAVIQTPTPDVTAVDPAPTVAPNSVTDGNTDGIVEGLNVIAGAPPVLPPARPGTVAPQNDAGLDALTSDVTTALATGIAQTPTPDTRRPLLRPAAVVQAAAALANTPVLGALNAAQASEFRPRTRPAGLAPAPAPVPTPEPVAVAAVAPAPTGLQIAPEIAAAVQAAANRPNPIVNPTALAVPVSSRPDPRPRNMDRIVARANQAQQRAATQVAAVAPRTVAPSGPTGNAVAANATLDNAINLRDVNLIGIYGGSNDRRALVRLANGRYVRVTVGDRLDGGRVTAISAGALSYTKRGRALTLQVAG